MKPSSIFPEKALALLGLSSAKPHDSYTRADRIFEGLSEAILAGYLEPRMKLPSEEDMALHFAVSRPVIRKALQRLLDALLVDSMRGSGSYVCAPSLMALSEPTQTTDISHILHGVELRLLNEPEAAALAAIRRTGEDIQRMTATVEAFANATATGESTHTHDYGFHEAIARYSKSAPAEGNSGPGVRCEPRRQGVAAPWPHESRNEFAGCG